MKPNRFFRSPILWIVLGFLAIALIFEAVGNVGGYTEKPTSEVVTMINGNEPLAEVLLTDGEQTIKITTKETPARKFRSYWVGNQSQDIIERLNARVAAGTLDKWGGEPAQPNYWSTFLFTVLPFLVIGFLFFFMFNNIQGGGNRVMGFGKSKAKLASKDTPKTTFSDVAGCEEAIEELQEIREFLSEPAKFTAVGAKIPKGVLLYGPPGTGKTLLAAATAGSLDATFFNVKVSSLVSKYFGESTRLISALFTVARRLSPAVIFLDEFESLTPPRGSGESGAERRIVSTFLAELDGMATKDDTSFVLTMGASNTPWLLDTAILSRFQRRIYVPLPDVAARRAILDIHLAQRGHKTSLSVEKLVDLTRGFSGREIEQLCQVAVAQMVRRLNPDLEQLVDQGQDKVGGYTLKVGALEQADLDAGFSQVHPLAGEALLRKYAAWNENMQQ